MLFQVTAAGTAPSRSLATGTRIRRQCSRIFLFPPNFVALRNKKSWLSTFLALNQLHNYILRLNDSGQHTCGIFLDLKKAFDTANHKILLDKLNHCGIRGLALDFFTSYLKNRQQFVFANGVQSNKMQITCGVPQGSTLGPMLFLLYINDLPLSSNFFCNIFADDTALLISDTDPKNLEKKKYWNKQCIQLVAKEQTYIKSV